MNEKFNNQKYYFGNNLPILLIKGELYFTIGPHCKKKKRAKLHFKRIQFFKKKKGNSLLLDIHFFYY